MKSERRFRRSGALGTSLVSVQARRADKSFFWVDFEIVTTSQASWAGLGVSDLGGSGSWVAFDGSRKSWSHQESRRSECRVPPSAVSASSTPIADP